MTEENKYDDAALKRDLESGKVSEQFKEEFRRSHINNIYEFVRDYRRWRAESLMRAREKIRGCAQPNYNP
jgi:hypothetical protein